MLVTFLSAFSVAVIVLAIVTYFQSRLNDLDDVVDDQHEAIRALALALAWHIDGQEVDIQVLESIADDDDFPLRMTEEE